MAGAFTHFRHVLHPADRLASGDTKPMVPCAAEYVQRIAANPSDGRGLSRRDRREMDTTALALDMLAQGKTAEAGDILVQRLKAVETANRSGSWEVAQQLELIPNQQSRVSQSELDVAGRQAMKRQTVERATKGKGRG